MTYETDDESSKGFKKDHDLERDIVKLRKWVARKHAQGCSLDEIATHAQVLRITCYRWITWSKKGRTLENLSRKPKNTKTG